MAELGADNEDDLGQGGGGGGDIPPTEKRGRGRPRKNDAAPKTPKTAAKGGWTKAPGVAKSLNTSFEGIVLVVSLLNEKDAAAIQAGAPDLVDAIVNLGINDARYRRYLELMAAPGNYGPIIMAAGAIIMPIAANHGLFDTFKRRPPATLETTDPQGVENE